MSTCAEQRLVDAHFGRGGSPRDEAQLRAHLPGCAACRDRYERHLALATLDPSAPSAQERLAHGLGLRLRPERRTATLGFTLTLVGSMAALAVLARTSHDPVEGTGSTFSARGPKLSKASPELRVYRLRREQAPELVRDVIGRDDELAFAYRNPTGFRYLFIYGVDEHGHRYWYHPARSPDARSVKLEPAEDPRELPEAISQPYDGASLRIRAIFS